MYIWREQVSLHFPILVDGLGSFLRLPEGMSDAAEVAAGAFAGCFCPAEGFFRVVEVVGDEHYCDKIQLDFVKFCHTAELHSECR